MDKIVLKDSKQFKSFNKRIFPNQELEEPDHYPCLCVYVSEKDFDRMCNFEIEISEYIYLEDFNKRHRRKCDIEKAKTRLENKKAAAKWRALEPETFADMSDGEVLNKAWQRIQEKRRENENYY